MGAKFENFVRAPEILIAIRNHRGKREFHGHVKMVDLLRIQNVQSESYEAIQTPPVELVTCSRPKHHFVLFVPFR